MDVTNYLQTYRMTACELAKVMISDVLHTTGITATAGIGSNLYLCKVAMDIMAKHVQPDKDGVRIAALDEMSYREQLWAHRPLTDFWRVGRGYAKKLEAIGIYTMGDVARCSIGKPNEYYNEELLYRMFGINAELLIDHAWGWEPVTLADIKAYRPEKCSMGAGQVLSCAYPAQKARIVVREMADALALELVDKRLVAEQLVLTVGYDRAGSTAEYAGPRATDPYGRIIPKPAHGTEHLPCPTASSKYIIDAAMALFDRIVDARLPVRRMSLVADRVTAEELAPRRTQPEQLDLFTDYAACEEQAANLEKEKHLQKAVLDIKKKYGKNAILKGMNYEDGATAAQRNRQIGGHKA